MIFKELLQKYKTDKTRVLINGLGDGETRGLIIEVHDDFVDYELLEVKTLKGIGEIYLILFWVSYGKTNDLYGLYGKG